MCPKRAILSLTFSSLLLLVSCLKLYCQCFALSRTCGTRCKCLTCHNTALNSEAIDVARKTILERNPSAFDSKIIREGPTTYPVPVQSSPSQMPVQQYSAAERSAPATSGAPSSGPPPRVNKYGCKCRRSFCLKKVRFPVVLLASCPCEGIA